MTNAWIVYLEPIYDARQKTYIKILTVSDMPDMPLAQYVRRLNTPKLSNLNRSYTDSKCIYAILKQLDDQDQDYNRGDTEYMEPNDIPRLFAYMVSNGYMIESGWTSILQKSKIGFGDSEKKTLVFVFRKN